MSLFYQKELNHLQILDQDDCGKVQCFQTPLVDGLYTLQITASSVGGETSDNLEMSAF